jgi:hypothetical protein
MDVNVRNILERGSSMPTDENTGVSGVEPIPPATRYVRPLSRSLAESWDIPKDTHRRVEERLEAVVADPRANSRAILAASKP